MSTVKEALSRLRNSVSRLEGSIHHMEAALAGQQRDMFGEVIPGKKGKGKGTAAAAPFDSSLISKRLDKAIKKVEELLEG